MTEGRIGPLPYKLLTVIRSFIPVGEKLPSTAILSHNARSLLSRTIAIDRPIPKYHHARELAARSFTKKLHGSRIAVGVLTDSLLRGFPSQVAGIIYIYPDYSWFVCFPVHFRPCWCLLYAY